MSSVCVVWGSTAQEYVKSRFSPYEKRVSSLLHCYHNTVLNLFHLFSKNAMRATRTSNSFLWLDRFLSLSKYSDIFLREGRRAHATAFPFQSVLGHATKRQFMSFTDDHVDAYIKYLEMSADELQVLGSSKLLPTVVGDNHEQSVKPANSQMDLSQRIGPLLPLHELLPGRVEGLEISYKFQNRVLELMKSKGTTLAAWRVSSSDAGFCQRWGLSAPVVAPVLSNMIYNDDDEVSIKKHKISSIEVHFGFRMIKTVRFDEIVPSGKQSGPLEELHTHIPLDCLLPYIDTFCPVIHLTGSRFLKGAPHAAAFVADLADGAAAVFGGEVPASVLKDIDFSSFPSVLFHDDEPIGIGNGGSVLGNPLRSIAYVAKNMKDTRALKVLEKGSLVLTGPITKSTHARPGRFTAHFGPLGKVSVTLFD